MNRRYFGTDGVRGAYGGPVMNEDLVARLAAAAGAWANRSGGPGAEAAVVVGRDTRASGGALEAAVLAGLAAAGLRGASLGVAPTPAIAWAVQRTGAPLGVAITASHNPASDNGVKFFAAGGRKLEDAEEAAIEEALPEAVGAWAPAGRGADGAGLVAAYLDCVLATVPAGLLDGWRVAVDAAHGAASGTTPEALARLGATVIARGVAPDGTNINASVGSEHPDGLAELVRREGSRLGLAHDGDADRLVLVDEQGGILDGDEVLAILALDRLRRGALPGQAIVATVQSNLGLDAALAAEGARVVRTPVGDRHVAAAMRRDGIALGGESSGHIICADVGLAGDGLLAALQVAAVMQRLGQPLSLLRQAMRHFPQVTRALRVGAKPPLAGLPTLPVVMAEVEAGLGGRGRILVRYSGTEPKLRLLAEADSLAGAEAAVAALEAAARADLDVQG